MMVKLKSQNQVIYLCNIKGDVKYLKHIGLAAGLSYARVREGAECGEVSAVI